MFHNPFPGYVKVMWVVIVTLLLAGGIMSYIRGKKIKEKEHFNPYNPEVEIEPFYIVNKK